MAHFPLTFSELQYLRRHKIHLETRFHLKIIMPDVFNPFFAFATTYGDKKETQNLRNLLKQKTGALPMNCLMDNPIPLISLSDTGCETPALRNTQKKGKKKKRKNSPAYSPPEPTIDNINLLKTSDFLMTCLMDNPVPLITLSDTECEISAICKTQKKRKKNKKKRKNSPGCSSLVAVLKEPAIDNIIPGNKRMKMKPASLAEDFIPLRVASGVKGARSVRVTSKTKSVPGNLLQLNDSIVIIEDTMKNSVVLDDSSIIDVPRPVAVRLRPIIIDGSNVAREHGKRKGKVVNGVPTDTFSCRGIQISVEFFEERGHTQVIVFIPKSRKHPSRHHIPTTDGYILDKLERRPTRDDWQTYIAYTPSRKIEGRLVTCYDDRFIVDFASRKGGVIFSNDNYQDLVDESESFKKTINERLLMFLFVGDILMVPDDPLGRHGPHRTEFLAFPENESLSTN